MISASDINRSSQLEIEYRYKKRIDISCVEGYRTYGNSHLFQHPSTFEHIAMKEIDVKDEKEFIRELAKIKEHQVLDHKNLINLIDFSSSKESNYVSSKFKLRAFYDYHPISLRRLMTEGLDGKNISKFRASMNNQVFNPLRLTSAEVTYLLYNTLSAVGYLYEKGLDHQDISPDCILVVPKVMEDKKNLKNKESDNIPELRFKIAFKLRNTIPAPHHYSRDIADRGRIYISPTVYSQLRKNLEKPIYNAEKNDVFALGLSILEASLHGIGTNLDPQNIYGDYDIDEYLLESMLNAVEKEYSTNKLFTSTLRQMLTISESDRPSFSSIINAIPSYNVVSAKLKDPIYNQNSMFIGSNSSQALYTQSMYRGGVSYTSSPAGPQRALSQGVPQGMPQGGSSMMGVGAGGWGSPLERRAAHGPYSPHYCNSNTEKREPS